MNNAETFLLEMACKSVALMAALCLLMVFWRRAAAATRHFLWFAFLGGLLLMPLGSVVGPGWRAPAWAAEKITPQWIKSVHVDENAPRMEIVGQLRQIQPAPKEAKVDSPPASRRVASSASHQFDWRRWLVFGWMAGVTVALGRLFLRWAMLRGIERASRVSDDSTAQSLLRTSQRELGFKRGVRLLESAQPLMPMTWGWWRPVVLLPSSLASWNEERLQFVLRHELAHVQRWDCLTQGVGNLVSALYWFNPLVWHAQRQMRLERERACDDVVLGLDARASDYAGHLLAVAGQFAYSSLVAALPMARRSNLEGRVRALLDFQRKRERLRPLAACGLATVAAVAALAVGGCKTSSLPAGRSTFQQKLVRITPDLQRQSQINVLKSFAAAKEQQAKELAAQTGESMSPDFHRFFDAATNGDSQAVLAMFERFRDLPAPDAERRRTDALAMNRSSTPWFPVQELGLAYDMVAQCGPRYTRMFTDGIIRSIPVGSIYFGGTYAGRGAPTAFCRSHIAGDPFFTLTQNALANNTYREYLRATYGKAIYMPTEHDSDKCFDEYLAGAVRRLKEHKLRPDEYFKILDERSQIISGTGAVMIINGLLTKLIFDKNPGREFYLEESSPMDWTYPYMEPHGLIMKLQRDPMDVLPNEAIARDREYWRPLVNEMIGPWLQEETPLNGVTEFVKKIYVRKDFEGFMGDPLFVHNDYATREFSKLRSTIAGLYAWRVGALKDVPTPTQYQVPKGAEYERIAAEADFAFRQAFAMCPDSPEVVTRYAYFLVMQDRSSEALVLAETAERVKKSMGGSDPKLEDLIQRLKAKTLIDGI